MNKVILIGHLCADPDVRYSQGENSMAVARYRLAVDRRYKREDEQNVDFISCVAFGKNGEFAEAIPIKMVRKSTQRILSLKNMISVKVKELLPAQQKKQRLRMDQWMKMDL